MPDYVLDSTNGGLIDVTPALSGDFRNAWDSPFNVTYDFAGSSWSIRVPGTIDVSAEIDGYLSRWNKNIPIDTDLAGSWNLTIAQTIDVAVEITGTLRDIPPIDIYPEVDGALVRMSLIVGTIDVAPAIDGAWVYGWSPTLDIVPDVYALWNVSDRDTITVTADFVGSSWLYAPVQAPIDVTAEADGAWIIIRVRQKLNREDRVEETGVRPSTPIPVYHVSARNPSDLVGIPDNSCFLVSALYDPNADDPLFKERGGRPGSIGERIAAISELDGQPTGQYTYAFRDPDPLEVVAYIGSLVLYRYEREEVWRVYQSLPQRALEGMQAFTSLDEDRIYDYYGKLIGAVYSQWSYDNQFLLKTYDPQQCPAAVLPYLAAQYGLRVTENETDAQKRTKIALAVPSFKLKGLEAGVALRLFSLGFVARVYEVWVWAANPYAFPTYPADSRASYDFVPDPDTPVESAVIGQSGQTITFSGNLTAVWSAGDFVLLRPAGALEAGIVLQAQSIVFTGSGTQVDFGFDIPALPAGLSGVNSVPAWIAVPHGYVVGETDFYFPSSRVIITLTDLEGNPITEPPQFFLDRNPSATLVDFWTWLGNDLGPDMLPVNADIKAFGVAHQNGDGVERDRAEDVVGTSSTSIIEELASFTSVIDITSNVLATMEVTP